MTHGEMIWFASDWLAHDMGCPIVLTEATLHQDERPDAIGWTGWKTRTHKSIVVECKMSRNDFRRDAKKKARLADRYGLGDFRYYMVPAGLVKPDEVPPRWGLLEVSPASGLVEHTVRSEQFRQKLDRERECDLLLTAISRYQYEVERLKRERQVGSNYLRNLQARVTDEVVNWLLQPEQEAFRQRILKSRSITFNAMGLINWDVATEVMSLLRRRLTPAGGIDNQQRQLFEMCLNFTLDTLVNWNTIASRLKSGHISQAMGQLAAALQRPSSDQGTGSGSGGAFSAGGGT